jgi:xanthine dehydrogenase/oxidase
VPKGVVVPVEAAHMARIDLSADGFYALADSRVGFDWEKEKPDDLPADSWKGHPFNYYTQGVACTEVEVDQLSGNHCTLRSDVMVDAGSSINPAIDIVSQFCTWFRCVL